MSPIESCRVDRHSVEFGAKSDVCDMLRVVREGEKPGYATSYLTAQQISHTLSQISDRPEDTSQALLWIELCINKRGTWFDVCDARWVGLGCAQSQRLAARVRDSNETSTTIVAHSQPSLDKYYTLTSDLEKDVTEPWNDPTLVIAATLVQEEVWSGAKTANK
jgi:hypothetical protein